MRPRRLGVNQMKSHVWYIGAGCGVKELSAGIAHLKVSSDVSHAARPRVDLASIGSGLHDLRSCSSSAEQQSSSSRTTSATVSFCIVLLAGAFAGWSSPSFAQRDPAPVISPLPAQPSAPSEAPDEKSSPDELGIRLGSFILYPTLDLRAGYDTNVFAVPAGQQTGSPYEAIRPSLDLKSDWNNHRLDFGAYGQFGFYNNANSQNFQNFGVTSSGQFDIQRNWYLTASAALTRTTEALGTPDVAQLTNPSVVWALPITLSMYQRFNRVFYEVSGGFTGLRYQDFATLNNSVLPAASRDRNEFSESLRVGYEVYDGLDFWAEGRLNQRSYLQYTNVANQARNSTGWAATGGATVDLGGISKLEGFVGYTQQTYVNPAVTTNAVVFGLGGVWNGYAPLVVRPFILRAINETAFTNYQDYVSTTFGAELAYTIQEGLTLNLGGSFSLLDYTPVPGSVGTFTHTDNYYRASLGLLYSIRPQIQLGPLYEFSAGNGPDPTTSQNFDRHVIMLRLVAKR